jgi:hypothetical protein
MFNYKIVKKFITKNEKNTLVDWILKNKDTEVFSDGLHTGTVRKTTRWAHFNKINLKYPDTAYYIRNRVDEFIFKNFKSDKIMRVPVFIDGMYASIASMGDCCEEHRDPLYVEDHITYHFNIMLTEHTDSKLIVNNEIVELNETDAILLPVSELIHGTTKLESKNYRMFWCFGYSIQ